MHIPYLIFYSPLLLSIALLCPLSLMYACLSIWFYCSNLEFFWTIGLKAAETMSPHPRYPMWIFTDTILWPSHNPAPHSDISTDIAQTPLAPKSSLILRSTQEFSLCFLLNVFGFPSIWTRFSVFVFPDGSKQFGPLHRAIPQLDPHGASLWPAEPYCEQKSHSHRARLFQTSSPQGARSCPFLGDGDAVMRILTMLKLLSPQ